MPCRRVDQRGQGLVQLLRYQKEGRTRARCQVQPINIVSPSSLSSRGSVRTRSWDGTGRTTVSFGTLPPAYVIMCHSYVAMLAIDRIRPLLFHLSFWMLTIRRHKNEERNSCHSNLCLTKHKDHVPNERDNKPSAQLFPNHLQGLME